METSLRMYVDGLCEAVEAYSKVRKEKGVCFSKQDMTAYVTEATNFLWWYVDKVDGNRLDAEKFDGRYIKLAVYVREFPFFHGKAVDAVRSGENVTEALMCINHHIKDDIFEAWVGLQRYAGRLLGFDAAMQLLFKLPDETINKLRRHEIDEDAYHAITEGMRIAIMEEGERENDRTA